MNQSLIHNPRLTIRLSNPRGFCAGVDRAIAIVNLVLERFGATIYVRHEVVHNRHVVEDFERRGVVFVEDLHEVPTDSIVVFSAHGVSQQVVKQARQRRLRAFDATCPLVTKVHMEVMKYAREGRECILIGHSGHPEVEGTMGRYEHSYGGRIYLVENCQQAENLTVKNADKLAFVTQTTLSLDDTQEIVDVLRSRFPAIIAPPRNDICYATQNRQNAIRVLAPECEVTLVVGSASSSNSNRLRELAARQGSRAFLIDGAEEIDPDWFNDGDTVGITAGASAPEALVQKVIERLQQLGAGPAEEQQGERETVSFALPKSLR